VMPGAHVPELGDHSVVWWDPKLLELGRNVDPARQRNHLLQPDESGSAEGRDRHDKWWVTRRQVTRDGRRPSEVIKSITELARGKQRRWGRVPVDVVEVSGRDATRPQGTRFGSLLHAVLADIPLNLATEPTAMMIDRLALSHGRLLLASTQEIDAAAEAAKRALEHDIMKRAARSPDCRREVPISLVLRDGALAEGIIDMAFKEPDDEALWTVVDFKSDRTLDAHGEAYFEQVRHYIDAIERATGDAAEGVLLLV